MCSALSSEVPPSYPRAEQRWGRAEGRCWLVLLRSPGEEHIETSIEETQVLVVKAEPNIQYQIDSDGNMK